LELYNKSKPEVVRGHGPDGNFLKTSATSKGATLQYLVCTAWGLSNNYLGRLKKKTMAEDGSVSTVLPATTNKSDSTNDEQCAVITNRELAKSIYSAKNHANIITPPNEPTVPQLATATRATSAPPPTQFQINNLYYCWTHGLSQQAQHTSATCNNKRDGHVDDATAYDRKGGTHKFNFGSQRQHATTNAMGM
jgi:hypothetical protein